MSGKRFQCHSNHSQLLFVTWKRKLFLETLAQFWAIRLACCFSTGRNWGQAQKAVFWGGKKSPRVRLRGIRTFHIYMYIEHIPDFQFSTLIALSLANSPTVCLVCWCILLLHCRKPSKPISTASELAKIKLSRYRLEKWVLHSIYQSYWLQRRSICMNQ